MTDVDKVTCDCCGELETKGETYTFTDELAKVCRGCTNFINYEICDAEDSIANHSKKHLIRELASRIVKLKLANNKQEVDP